MRMPIRTSSKIGIPLAPFTLALVLGNRAEDSFRLSMIRARRRPARLLVERPGFLGADLRRLERLRGKVAT